MDYVSPWMDAELEGFRDAVRRFVDHEVMPHQQRWREQQHVDREVWRQAGEMGLLLADIPEEYGGSGGSFAHQCVVFEELSCAGDTAFGLHVHAIVAHYLLNQGTEEQKRAYLPKLASGEMIAAIAMSEPGAGSDLKGIRTTAIRGADGYRLNGSKTFFDDAHVPLANVLGGEEGRGFAQLMTELPYERTIVGVCGVASIERAIRLTVEHAKERKAFGQALIEMQNTRFVLAEARTEAFVARVFVDRCIEDLIAGRMDTVQASMAKYWITDLQCKIVDQCVQLFGGYGYMLEYPIAQMYLDARVQRIYGGANEIMKEIIARSL
jgi:acyl-CoA dehydrogenase